MFNIFNNTTFFNFLPSPPSITIGLCIPLFNLFFFHCIFSSDFFGTRRHLFSWLTTHEFILTHVIPHYFLGGLIVPHFPTPPLTTLPLDALPIHSVFWHIHCFAISSPSCNCFLLELASECLLLHASKCSPYPVPSLCIHWLNILHPILLPVHYRTINLGFCIFSKCVACTCLSYCVIFPHILVNISLSCFPRSILLQNKLWHIFIGTPP